MEITKEWEELVQKIYDLVKLDCFWNTLELTIPRSIFVEWKPEVQEEKNRSLSYCHIKLTAISYCTGPKIEKTIKIKFGLKEKIDNEKKEIIVDFKYASKLVLYLVHLIQPNKLTIKTQDLTEQNDIFSPPISTMDS